MERLVTTMEIYARWCRWGRCKVMHRVKASEKRRNLRGASVVELLAAAMIVGFLVAGSAALITVGEGQEVNSRMYSYLQTNLRSAMHPMTRALRHGYGVDATGTGVLAARTSGANVIVCTIPTTPVTFPSTNIEIAFYVSGGTLYYERSTDASATSLMTGVNSLTVVYYTTAAGVTTVAATPSAATEIQLTVSATDGPVTTSAQAYVWMRN